MESYCPLFIQRSQLLESALINLDPFTSCDLVKKILQLAISPVIYSYIYSEERRIEIIYPVQDNSKASRG
jgi:hypothetical protein